MRKRDKQKTIWLSEEESKKLKKDSSRAGLDESNYIRLLIMGYKPKEQPVDEVYKMLNGLNSIGVNLNQIARKANALNFIDVPAYKKVCEKLDKLDYEMRKVFLGID